MAGLCNPVGWWCRILESRCANHPLSIAAETKGTTEGSTIGDRGLHNLSAIRLCSRQPDPATERRLGKSKTKHEHQLS